MKSDQGAKKRPPQPESQPNPSKRARNEDSNIKDANKEEIQKGSTKDVQQNCGVTGPISALPMKKSNVSPALPSTTQATGSNTNIKIKSGKKSPTTVVLKKFDISKLGKLLRRNNPTKEEKKMIQLICKLSKTSPVWFGSEVDASQALQIPKSLVQQAHQNFDEKRQLRQNLSFREQCPLTVAKALDALPYWLRRVEAPPKGGYRYGSSPKDYVPKAGNNMTPAKKTIGKDSAETAIKPKVDQPKDSSIKNLNRTSDPPSIVANPPPTNPKQKDPNVNNSSKPKNPAKKAAGSTNEQAAPATTKAKSPPPALDAFRAAAAASSAVTAGVAKGTAENPKPHHGPIPAVLKKSSPVATNTSSTVDSKAATASSAAVPKSSATAVPVVGKSKASTAAAIPSSKHAVPGKHSGPNASSIEAIMSFDVSTLLPVSRTKYYEPARSELGIIELKCKGTGKPLVCFGNILDASLALDSSKKHIRRALEGKHHFPTYTLRYVQKSKAYQYGSHDEDFKETFVKETHDQRLKRWKKAAAYKSTMNMNLQKQNVANNANNNHQLSAPTLAKPAVAKPAVAKPAVAMQPSASAPAKATTSTTTTSTINEVKIRASEEKQNTNDVTSDFNSHSKAEYSRSQKGSTNNMSDNRSKNDITTSTDAHFSQNQQQENNRISDLGSNDNRNTDRNGTNSATNQAFGLCIVCQEKPIQVVFEPCHHCLVCVTCASMTCKTFCPQCRLLISKRLKPTLVKLIRPRVYSAHALI